MRPLLLNTTDIEGGAALAVYRLHNGLKRIGINSMMMVGRKVGDDASVIGPNSKLGKGIGLLRPGLDVLPLQFYRNRNHTIFSTAYLHERLTKRVVPYDPDIIHLHWVCEGFLRIENLQRFSKPVIWTLHDMWAFTGGCHYDEYCDRYNDACGACPQLNSKRQNDLSHWVWKRKKKSWQDLDITIVSPSLWLAGRARTSSLFRNCRVEVIPYGLNTDRYKPIDKKFARHIFGLPQDKKLILFGAVNAFSDKRKGFQFFLSTLHELASKGWSDRAELVVFGSSEPPNPSNFGLKARYMGRLHDDISLAILYAAADVFVLPSIQDNLPNTVMESLACGTPVAAFNVGGISDMVDHQINGYLVRPMDSDDLARGIHWILTDPERYARLAKAAREKTVREYAIEVQARRYRDLYEEILGFTAKTSKTG